MTNKRDVSLKWLDLEQRAESNFFLSWSWIGNWLEIINGKVFLVEAVINGQIVGLGFFVEKSRKIFGLIPIKQWHLHRTGDTKQDQIWIEHNDFLLNSEVENTARKNMIKAVYDFDSSIEEIVVGLSRDKVLSCFLQCFHQSNFLIKTHGYSVDFTDIKQNYLAEVLSKNTRSQLKRSEKLLSHRGELNFTVITEKEAIKQILNDVSDIHIERWGSTSEGSGFANPLFCKFHHEILNTDRNHVMQIAVLTLANKSIGYLLNFVYKEQVYFYLSALKPLDDNKIKVGLTLHTKAIEFYQEQGLKCYDFLGGDARYKKSLSNKQYNLSLGCFQRNHLLLKLESKLKYYKSTLKSIIFN